MEAAPATDHVNHGIYGSEEEALQGLIDHLVAAADPEAIWLFGSRAQRNHRPDSDFDLLVVAKPGAPWGSDDYEFIYRATSGTRIGCDVVPVGHDDFEEAATLHTTLVSIVVDEGRKIYEARS
ncbi:nucleotidyltransferase domain-containing protein [Oharaeibacter diazotrophicus]|uniref:Nucleotidyltransferase-like protein n=1 Tax=Oharaeibacter diazotrophicus TaxID=1920512 RepID=A0A4R6RJQ8_9HYPH|nr:nucleotidyltransferase domain-containing protein [Oharaeibacter diazotrophicus]TDP86674.1 nucleotidyltransferase-like protein [Oharaeibacter diazotrophicus]BBE71384.1 nucleotidyltransferase domain protein [Pleomorphomonas sp. SM30]GLS78141.1 hypothetical protein GCM10007904_34780 [Oharaeibacter diazotrophicus]